MYLIWWQGQAVFCFEWNTFPQIWYKISLQWDIVQCINLSGAKTGIIWYNSVNTMVTLITMTSQWPRHRSTPQPHDCLLSRLYKRRSKETSKLRVTGLCAGNSPGTGEFPAQMASYAENVSIRWRHHGYWLHVSTRNDFACLPSFKK